MFAKSLWLSLPLIVVFGQPANDLKAKHDLKQMQGAWVLHALEVNGKDVPAAKLQNTLLIVKGDDYRTTVKGQPLPGFRITLDPSKKPAAMDMFQALPGQAEKKFKAIYLLDKDTLKICRGLTTEDERPGQFATWPDTNYFVVTWKRQEK
ncbi:MAG: TIGR03067 domain-containing protein [Planctomycetes bacterium]|nr:TIGR03067 domain-containing protein [Planctomycetota bacterium]